MTDWTMCYVIMYLFLFYFFFRLLFLPPGSLIISMDVFDPDFLHLLTACTCETSGSVLAFLDDDLWNVKTKQKQKENDCPFDAKTGFIFGWIYSSFCTFINNIAS